MVCDDVNPGSGPYFVYTGMHIEVRPWNVCLYINQYKSSQLRESNNWEQTLNPALDKYQLTSDNFLHQVKSRWTHQTEFEGGDS